MQNTLHTCKVGFADEIRDGMSTLIRGIDANRSDDNEIDEEPFNDDLR